MQALTDYFAMGGYAVFVWPAYALSIAVMLGLFLQGLRRYRRSQRLLEEIQRAQPARARRARP